MTAKSTENRGEKIAKVLARRGVASRREAERMIRAGRISIAGRQETNPAERIDPSVDIKVDGKPVATADKASLWRYHKTAGTVTTASDPEGRPTVFEKLPADIGRVISVGRLDLNSEGLLLLTNDGGLARWMELPKTGWKRRYRARVYGTPDKTALGALAKGIEIDGIRYGSIEAQIDRQGKNNSWLTISLREGRNREIRKVLSHLGLTVNRLIRTSFGPFQLGDLKPGAIDQVRAKALRDQLGAKIGPDGIFKA